MTEEQEQRYQAQFVGFTTALATSAMQQMGKLMNPLTGKVERNLEAARGTIDILEMLQAKTNGNLSKQEQEVLQNWLTNLRLNYVDEAKAAQEEEKKPEEETEKAKAEKTEPEKEPAPEQPQSEPEEKPEAAGEKIEKETKEE